MAILVSYNVFSFEEALSVLMPCMPNNCWKYFCALSVCFLMKKLALTQKSVLNMASRHSQINKPQCRCPKRAELLDVNINTGVQSINSERASSRDTEDKCDFST